MVQVTPAKRKEGAGLVIDRNESLTFTPSVPNPITVPPSLKKRKSTLAAVKEDTPSFEEQLEKLSQSTAKVENPEDLWKRPALNPLDPSVDAIVFQQIDVDDVVQAYPETLANPHSIQEASTVRMFGCTMEGHSVTCHVHGFLPYLYVPAPVNFQPHHKEVLHRALNDWFGANRNNRNVPVVDIEMVLKSSIFGYHGKKKALFLRITFRLQSQISAAKRAFTQGIEVPGFGKVACDTYESNIPYPLRFMIDTKIQGASWVELPPSSYQIRTDNAISSSQIEIDVHYSDIRAHQPEGEWQKIAPLRILSFDIECAGRKGIFPEAQVDPVIQIANMVTIQGENRPFIRNVLTLKNCANIVGTHTMSFDDERDLLRKWSEFVVAMDPDLIIGYNINGFDFPYLLDRAAALKVNDFPYLGRIKMSRTNAKDSRFSSKGLGTRDTKTINLEGRLQMDVLQVMQRDYKLRSYTLNSVCAHFLNEQKEDVHYSIIADLQNGNDETRRRLAIYCLKDAYLPQRLIDKLMCVINYMEMARVTGVPFNYLLTRGQQIKVVSQLYRKAKTEDLLIPAKDAEGSDDVQYEGATVIEPEKGFYEQPIATLDFTSLYPSIMMAHNLCYSTHLETLKDAERHGLVRDKDYKVTPDNAFFVKPSVRKGILPTILEDLLAARKRAKNDLKKETDPFKRAVLDGRQLALKVSANSVYGFTGATIGKLPLLAISSSVTAYGREMIELTKSRVESKYTIENGYEFDAKVIYGDTDSVMVKFGVPTVGEAMKLGREAANYVTGYFEKPINLDFEKVYFPYLLINKKRYAGLYWTSPDKHDKMDTKGIETVRRDSCRLVSSVIETCLKKILVDRDVTGAEEYTKGVISDLLQNKIDLSQLVISKALGKTEYSGKQAHNELAERMRKRDAGSAPAIGDRVAYVIAKGTKNAAAYEKAEDPIYVLENNIPIDTKYYLENQLSKPLMRIFEPILGSKANRLLTGDHTRTISVAAPAIGGLMKFAVKSATCLGCKTVLPRSRDATSSDPAVCEHCRPRLPELYVRHLDAQHELEVRFARLWTQCQRCQGSLHQDVICTAQDCPIFYMRKKAQKDMGETAATVKRFDYAW
ncbi:DNA-directed DNA polymerase [Powellomyces hirtus]|uniref:DNA polymerase n=1 Tax=Powellomyces hirtus TaxID=109895 RepID=A0A507E111_9FUNG|nr:DNA-directed DNA polymerase [Powellomyces hirtus]